MKTIDGDDALDRGLRGVRAAGEALVASLGLRPLAVPDGLHELEGTLRGAPVRLRTRRFSGGALAALTLAEIAEVGGPLRAVTMIGMPGAGTLAPILGIDLVALGGALSLVAVDLAPTDEMLWATLAAPLLERLQQVSAGRTVARRWPEFAVEVFSPRALLAGARRGREAAVLADVAWFVSALRRLYWDRRASVPARQAEAEARRRRWCVAERRNRREHDALAQMFGVARAGAYLDLLLPSGDGMVERSNSADGQDDRPSEVM